MGLWEQQLHEASLGGVAFPVASRRITGGRAYAPRKYPHRDGQDVEDTGREPYTFELEVPLFADVDAAHYPDTYEALRLVVDDEADRGELEYVDVELGPVPVKVRQWNWSQTARERDGGVFSVVLEERTHEA